jgi:hypothetical protein
MTTEEHIIFLYLKDKFEDFMLPAYYEIVKGKQNYLFRYYDGITQFEMSHKIPKTELIVFERKLKIKKLKK